MDTLERSIVYDSNFLNQLLDEPAGTFNLEKSWKNLLQAAADDDDGNKMAEVDESQKAVAGCCRIRRGI